VNNDKSAAPSTSDGSVASFDGGSNGTVAADFFFRPSTPKSKASRKRKRSFFTEGGATTTDRNNSNYYYSPLRNSEFVTSPEYAAEFSPVLSGPSTPKRMEGSVRHSGHQRKQEHPHRAPLS